MMIVFLSIFVFPESGWGAVLAKGAEHPGGRGRRAGFQPDSRAAPPSDSDIDAHFRALFTSYYASKIARKGLAQQVFRLFLSAPRNT